MRRYGQFLYTPRLYIRKIWTATSSFFCFLLFFFCAVCVSADRSVRTLRLVFFSLPIFIYAEGFLRAAAAVTMPETFET